MRWKNNVYSEYDRLESMRKREKDTLEDQLSNLQAKTESLVEKEREKCEERIAEL